MVHYEIILIHVRNRRLSRNYLQNSTRVYWRRLQPPINRLKQRHMLISTFWGHVIRFDISPQKKKKRQKRKSILKTDLKWNFWKSDYVALKVSCAPQIIVLGLSSLPQGSSLGKTDSSSHKHRLMPVALPSWKKPHENSPIHTWHVTWYSYVLVWFRKPYCCDFLVHTWFPSYMEDTCIADIPAQSSDS